MPITGQQGLLLELKKIRKAGEIVVDQEITKDDIEDKESDAVVVNK
jgi:hypothetical protein